MYLVDGLKLVIVGLGIFAIPEIVALLRQDRAISRDSSLGAGWLDGIRDWYSNLWQSIRCSIIGVIVGVIPGLGGSVVDWIAYGHTVQSTRDKSKFGSGSFSGLLSARQGAVKFAHGLYLFCLRYCVYVFDGGCT